jgi:hypothetical protein
MLAKSTHTVLIKAIMLIMLILAMQCVVDISDAIFWTTIKNQQK